mgnify:CR=1 FL=1
MTKKLFKNIAGGIVVIWVFGAFFYGLAFTFKIFDMFGAFAAVSYVTIYLGIAAGIFITLDES